MVVSGRFAIFRKQKICLFDSMKLIRYITFQKTGSHVRNVQITPQMLVDLVITNRN
jgi:hypothetical protein